ncbi:MAG: nucleotidyltransferase family protein [Polyangiaceae bacterium]|nr:nucleotidyltransferase family protein [Polyangiaceae bacterium]
MTERPVLGLVLAAGASRRTGFPKALAVLDGETLLQRACAALRNGGCAAVYVVVGGMLEASIREAMPAGARLCENPAPHLGMSSSLASALMLPEVAEADAVVVSLVDHPRVTGETVAQLIAHWRESGAGVLRPTHAGRGGHPYVLDRRLFAEFLRLPRGSDPRPFFAAHLESLDVDDPGILDDADELHDLLALGAEPPAF